MSTDRWACIWVCVSGVSFILCVLLFVRVWWIVLPQSECVCVCVFCLTAALVSVSRRHSIIERTHSKLLPSPWWMCWCSRYQKQQKAKRREDEENIEDSLLLVGATAATTAVVAIHFGLWSLSFSLPIRTTHPHKQACSIVVCAWQPDSHHTNTIFVRVWVRHKYRYKYTWTEHVRCAYVDCVCVWMLSFLRGFHRREKLPSCTRPNILV